MNVILKLDTQSLCQVPTATEREHVVGSCGWFSVYCFGCVKKHNMLSVDKLRNARSLSLIRCLVAELPFKSMLP